MKYSGMIKGEKGFSLPEILAVSVVTVFLMLATVSMWMFTCKVRTVEMARTRLRVNLEISMERIKKEMRLSSSTYMSGYPLDAAEYTALSFPLATPDENGFYTLSSGFVSWDTSVIYHSYLNTSTGKHELRRTVFTSNHDVLIDKTKREAQLTSVVTVGDGSAAENKANAVTTVIVPRSTAERKIEDVDFKIVPIVQTFNCYSPDEQRTNVSFGCIDLAPGEHDLKFTVTGKDAASSDYKFGIDTLSISPSGCNREPEILLAYTNLLDTIYGSSGDSETKNGPDSKWSGSYYLEYASNAQDDYLTLRLYYDLWRDSNFSDAQMDNMLLSGNDLNAKLANVQEGAKVSWQGSVEASGPTGTSTEADYPGPIDLRNKTIRVRLSQSNIMFRGDMVRFKFVSNSALPLRITKAYLDIRDETTDTEPKLKYDPADGAQLELYQTYHAQIFFRDVATGEIMESVTIDPSNPQSAAEPKAFYSDWVIYPFDSANSYFVTFHIADDAGNAYAGYCPGVSGTSSYLVDGEANATLVNWAGYTDSVDVFSCMEADIWRKDGSVTSAIYDTQISSPAYASVCWNENKPTNSTILVKARSSAAIDMAGASDWDSITGSGTNPHDLSIGTGQYVQFRADLGLNLTWTCLTHTGVAVTDTDYKHSGVISCTETGCTKYLIPQASIATGSYCPWIDNVTIDWPGADKICQISGYLRQAPDYGIITLTVDGQPLMKVLNFQMTIRENILSKIYDASLAQDIEVRNTGK